VKDDDELVIAISHQIPASADRNLQDGQGRTPRRRTRAADCAAQAGFDIAKAPAFRDRVAAEEFWKISSDMDGTYIPHGAMSQRILAIRGAVSKGEDLTQPSDMGEGSSSGEAASVGATIREEVSAP
jgi:hypothetical protein